MIKTAIGDISTSLTSEVVELPPESYGVNVKTKTFNGQVVFSHPLIQGRNKQGLFTSTTQGISMAISGSTVTATENIHDGGDNSYWTAIATQGTWNFASTDQALNGSQSIDATATVNDDYATISPASAVSVNGFTSLKIAIYISQWQSTGTKEVEISFYNGGTIRGNAVNISTYVNIGNLNTWQTAIIPLNDMGISTGTVDELRIKTVDIGSGVAPDYYLDTIALQQLSSSVYRVEPERNTWYKIKILKLTMVDALARAADGSIPLSYNKLLGVNKLTNGIVFTHVVSNEILTSANFKQLSDITRLPGAELTMVESDGTNTILEITIKPGTPLLLKSETLDYMQMAISDDLSGLIDMWISYQAEVIKTK